ncbi:hypothetical protein BD1_18 [Octadecabacter Antarctic BD virus 1]|nr:hypothetical protein BD1_18 [Octadecabacter Antarctic BD virus 1]
MANAIYPLFKAALIGGGANVDLSGGTVKAALIDLDTYTYDAAHEFLDDISGVVGTAVTLGTKTVTGGAFDSANPTWASVTGATVEAVILYVDTGTPSTSRLVLYLDTGQTDLPVTPNGGNIVYTVGSNWTQF